MAECRLVLGDCREVLPTLEGVTAVITDPPYGVNLGKDNNQSNDCTHLHKAAYANYDDTYENFVSLIVPRLNAAIDVAKRAAIFSGPHIHEQRKPVAIGGIWHPSATGRTPWGSKNFLPVLFYGIPEAAGRHRPTVIRSVVGSEKNGHPCPKPLEWMKWLVELTTEPGDTVFDPFMGSGTTAVACHLLERNFIGCEIDPAYHAIAQRRIAAELSRGNLFATQP